MRRRLSATVGLLLILWFAIGAIAAFQRGYFKGAPDTCAETGTVIVTIVSGPLNYVGVNPKIDCTLPQPSR